jgi:hypothetical protein
MGDHPKPVPYEPPALSVLGGVHQLTGAPGGKNHGNSDGYAYHAGPIISVSR